MCSCSTEWRASVLLTSIYVHMIKLKLYKKFKFIVFMNVIDCNYFCKWQYNLMAEEGKEKEKEETLEKMY